MISLYCDGASTGKSNRPGGWGFVIVHEDEVVAWHYGGDPHTTNNKMELQAAIEGLQACLSMGLDKTDAVELVSDSQYVLGVASGSYQPVANLDLTSILQELASKIKSLRFRWIRGHSGDRWNEKADELASLGKLENLPPEIQRLMALKRIAKRRARRESLAALDNDSAKE